MVTNNEVDNAVDKPMTTVKIQCTEVKYYSAESNTIVTVELMGKIPVAYCKKYVKKLNDKNIFIGKSSTNISFKVCSFELYALKPLQED